jgi:hypothetical protein
VTENAPQLVQEIRQVGSADLGSVNVGVLKEQHFARI